MYKIYAERVAGDSFENLAVSFPIEREDIDANHIDQSKQRIVTVPYNIPHFSFDLGIAIAG